MNQYHQIAQTQSIPTPDFSVPGQFSNLTQFTWQKIVTYGINLVLVIAAIAFFFMFLIAGVSWITSAGDKAKIEAARSKITSAFVGLTITFAIFAIVYLLNQMFGVNIGGLGSAPPTVTPTP